MHQVHYYNFSNKSLLHIKVLGISFTCITFGQKGCSAVHCGVYRVCQGTEEDLAIHCSQCSLQSWWLVIPYDTDFWGQESGIVHVQQLPYLKKFTHRFYLCNLHNNGHPMSHLPPTLQIQTGDAQHFQSNTDRSTDQVILESKGQLPHYIMGTNTLLMLQSSFITLTMEAKRLKFKLQIFLLLLIFERTLNTFFILLICPIFPYWILTVPVF